MRAPRWPLPALVLLLLVALAAPASAAPATPPGETRPPATATTAVDWTYSYAAAYQSFSGGERPTRLHASYTVHRPRQVRPGDHSLVEMAVEAPGGKRSFIEVGVRTFGPSKPKLFVFWWFKNKPRCYDFGCGFVRKGTGLKPGSTLKPGATIRLGWVHERHKWWLVVNGKRSGYYPDRQWKGRFRSAGAVQVYGEVATRKGRRICADMGSGRLPGSKRSARVFDVRYPGGPPVALAKHLDYPRRNFRIRMQGGDAFRYGGPGVC
jgi:hypothetical protein